MGGRKGGGEVCVSLRILHKAKVEGAFTDSFACHDGKQQLAARFCVTGSIVLCAQTLNVGEGVQVNSHSRSAGTWDIHSELGAKFDQRFPTAATDTRFVASFPSPCPPCSWPPVLHVYYSLEGCICSSIESFYLQEIPRSTETVHISQRHLCPVKSGLMPSEYLRNPSPFVGETEY